MSPPPPSSWFPLKSVNPAKESFYHTDFGWRAGFTLVRFFCVWRNLGVYARSRSADSSPGALPERRGCSVDTQDEHPERKRLPNERMSASIIQILDGGQVLHLCAFFCVWRNLGVYARSRSAEVLGVLGVLRVLGVLGREERAASRIGSLEVAATEAIGSETTSPDLTSSQHRFLTLKKPKNHDIRTRRRARCLSGADGP